MHDCEKFREDLTDHILGAGGLGPLTQELNACDECRNFYHDALALVEILDSVQPQPAPMSEDCSADFGRRLRERLAAEAPAPRVLKRSNRLWTWSAGAAAAAVVLGLTSLAFRAARPLSLPAPSGSAVQIEDDHIKGVDPGTIEFLGQSELFLRSFVKIEPTDLADLEDARNRARLQLAGLSQRKDAVVDFAPMQTVLDDYETVLRDIENLDQSSAEDITDVQGRIERNGLIASMKAYQPRTVLVTEQ